MPDHRKARAAAKKRGRAISIECRKKLARALERYAAAPKAASVLDQACNGLGVVGHMPLCNFDIRLKAQNVLSGLFLQQYDRLRHDPDLRWFLFTATLDDGITYENAPVVDFARMELKIRRLLQSLNLNAVCSFEVDVLAKKVPGDAARLLLFHVHALCWTRDHAFAPVKVARELSGLAPFNNKLGVPSINFTSRAMSAPKNRNLSFPDDPRFRELDRDQNAWSIADLGRYMLKAPTFAKDRSQRADGTWWVRKDPGGFGLKTALRFAEIWSQTTPSEAVFGVGPEGGGLSRAFSARMRRYGADLPQTRQRPLERTHVAQAWRQLFDTHPKLGLTASVIVHRAK